MDGYQEALGLLPPEIAAAFRTYRGQAEELRLRRGQAPRIYDGCRDTEKAAAVLLICMCLLMIDL